MCLVNMKRWDLVVWTLTSKWPGHTKRKLRLPMKKTLKFSLYHDKCRNHKSKERHACISSSWKVVLMHTFITDRVCRRSNSQRLCPELSAVSRHRHQVTPLKHNERALCYLFAAIISTVLESHFLTSPLQSSPDNKKANDSHCILLRHNFFIRWTELPWTGQSQWIEKTPNWIWYSFGGYPLSTHEKMCTKTLFWLPYELSSWILFVDIFVSALVESNRQNYLWVRLGGSFWTTAYQRMLFFLDSMQASEQAKIR